MGCSTSDSKNQQQNTELIFPPRPKVGEVVLKVSPRNNIEAGAVDSKNNFDAEGCESIQKSGDGTQTQNVVEQPYTMQMLMQHAVTVLQTPEAEINAQIVCVNEEGNDIGTFELNDVQKALELPFVSEIKICLKKQLESQRQSEEKQVRFSTMFPAVASPKRDLVASAVPVEEEPDDFFEASDQGNFGILFRMQKRILCWFSKFTKQVSFYKIRELPCYMEGAERFVWLSDSLIFIAGGLVKKTSLSDWFEVSIISFNCRRMKSMIFRRGHHGLIEYDEMIYAFGGIRDKWDVLMESEVYHIKQEQWSTIPDMPESGNHISCVKMKKSIYITSERFSLLMFTPETQVYKMLEVKNHNPEADTLDIGHNSILCHSEKLILITQQNRKELTEDGETINEFDGGLQNLDFCDQFFVDEENVFYMIGQTGQVYELDHEKNIPPIEVSEPITTTQDDDSCSIF